MSDSYLIEDAPSTGSGGDTLPGTVDKTRKSTNAIGISAAAFSSAITKSFTQAVTGGKQFDDVLKSLALKISSLTVAAAFKPVAKGLTGGLNDIFNGIFGNTPSVTAQMGAVKPFASGGVIGTPTYFPLASGGLGLAGEAGPEAIMPLSRGADGQLGISMNGGTAPANISVQIATPDPGSFRRSEAYITGQIARAVARGQRSL
jgi:phage-related minor tail protein